VLIENESWSKGEELVVEFEFERLKLKLKLDLNSKLT
jgi:hypothetical protein